jgi:hypothetical protein
MFIARGHTGMGTSMVSIRGHRSQEFSSAKTIAISVVLRLRLEAALFMNGPYRFYFFTQGKTFDYEIDSAQTRTGGFQSLPATTWCLVKFGPKLEEYLRNLRLFHNPFMW